MICTKPNTSTHDTCFNNYEQAFGLNKKTEDLSMLTKCMLNPINLARRLEWNAKIGKPRYVCDMCVSNCHILTDDSITFLHTVL